MIRILRHTLCLALLLTLAACEKRPRAANRGLDGRDSPPGRRFVRNDVHRVGRRTVDAVVYRRGIRRDAGRRRPRGDDGHGDRFRTQLRQGAPEAGHDNRPPPRQQGRLSGRGLPAARRGDADPSAVHARTKPDRLLRAQHRGRQCGRDEPNPGRRAHSGLLPAREAFVGRPAGDPLRPGDGTVRTNDAQNLRRLQRRKPRKGAAAVRRCRGAGSGPKLRADHRLPRQGVDSGRQRLALLLDAAFRRGRPMGRAPGPSRPVRSATRATN